MRPHFVRETFWSALGTVSCGFTTPTVLSRRQVAPINVSGIVRLTKQVSGSREHQISRQADLEKVAGKET